MCSSKRVCTVHSILLLRRPITMTSASQNKNMNTKMPFFMPLRLLFSTTLLLLVPGPSHSFVSVSVVNVNVNGNGNFDWHCHVDAGTTTAVAMASSDARVSSSSSPFPSSRTAVKPKYPVQRGEELDSRKIVANNRQHLTAIRLNHILFATEELATQTLYGLKTATLAFDDLAEQVSNCDLTRHEKGAIGWVNTNTNNDANNRTDDQHLDLILPPDARNKILNMNTKVRKS